MEKPPPSGLEGDSGPDSNNQSNKNSGMPKSDSDEDDTTNKPNN